MLCIGVTAYAFAVGGFELLLSKDQFSLARKAVLAVFAVYCIGLLFESNFLFVIVFYFPALLVSLCGFIKLFKESRNQQIRKGIGGLMLSLIAPFFQQFKIELHPVYLTHNTVYHLILMISIYLFFIGVKGVLDVKKESS